MPYILLLLFLVTPVSTSSALPDQTPVQARVKDHNGAPAVFINSKPVFITGFLAGVTAEDKVYREIAESGIHVYMDYVSIGNEAEGKYDFSASDAYFKRILALDPEAYFIPRIGVTAPWWWQQKHKDELCRYADGKLGPQSFSSEKWKLDMKEDLTAFIKHIRTSPYAGRVLGFLICSGYSAEWQAWGLWDKKVGDFSKAAASGFRKWLKAKYKTDEALRNAWKDQTVTLDSASIPAPADRKKASRLNFYDPEKDGRRIPDFYLYYSDVAADAIIHFAGVVKDASGGNMLAGFFYGYLNQHGFFQQESEHNAVQKVLDCPDIDFFASPACYSVRGPGGTSNFMTMAESLKLHGKMHFNESDIRTFLSPKDDPFGRCGTPEESLGVLKREMGHVLSRGANLWWFDMTGGWFSDKRILGLFTEFQKAAQDSMSRPRTGNAEIAVIYDDRSMASFRPGALGTHLLVEPAAEWPRVGAPQDFYILSDISHPNMPAYKLYIFLNAFDLNEERIKDIHAKLRKDRAAALWVYAPGFAGESLSVERMKQVTGINLVAEDKELSSTIKLDSSKAFFRSEKLPDPVGTSYAHGPVFYADDPEVEVLGTLEALGKPGFAIKQMEGWSSIFYASPYLPYRIIRTAAEHAGVHIYCRSNDCFYSNRGIVALHASESGEKTIRLKQKADIYDLLTGVKIAEDTDTVKTTVKAGDTVLFKISSRSFTK